MNTNSPLHRRIDELTAENEALKKEVARLLRAIADHIDVRTIYYRDIQRLKKQVEEASLGKE